MNKNSLLRLKSEIINSKDKVRLLELEINLKHFTSILSHRVTCKDEYSEEEIKAMESSIYLARSYVSVLAWRLQDIISENDIKRINHLVDNKKAIFEVFEAAFQSFLTNQSNVQALKKENGRLKSLVNELTRKLNSLQDEPKKGSN